MIAQRRRLVIAGLASAAFAATAAIALAQPAEKTIRIVARKFEFVPAEITLEKGVPVVLELTTQDVAMGFYAPDFKIDVEIIPGKAVQLRLLPEKTGSFQFICDVFCGEGHEDMGGRIHVV